MRRAAVTIAIGLLASSAAASPNLSLDDPAYEQLAVLRALGRLPAYQGGLQPITRTRAIELIDGPAELDRRMPDGWWIEPITRASVRVVLARDLERPYSTLVRPRDVAGSIALSCEHGEGRPCGDGMGGYSELESSVGYGRWVSASLRVRGVTGTDAYNTDLELDRAYVNAELGYVALEAGRDVLVLGPSSHTQLAWGDNAPPLDHARISTAHPASLRSQLRVNAAYVLGRLRSPQTYPGGYVSIVRGQLDIADSIEVGVTQLLQLGGDGAPAMSVWDSISEHFRRADKTASASDSSNRRFGGDITVRIAELAGARLYYSLIFEDIRRARFIDAFRYDADHLLGLELAALGPDAGAGIMVEWHHTGVRSQEHDVRKTGFTNADFVVGAPLGPDAESLYAGGRLELGACTLYPWLELARLSSDTYEFVIEGPITRSAIGEDEARYRAGARARVPLRGAFYVDAQVAIEHIDDAAFESGAARNNGLLSVSVAWYPTISRR